MTHRGALDGTQHPHTHPPIGGGSSSAGAPAVLPTSGLEFAVRHLLAIKQVTTHAMCRFTHLNALRASGSCRCCFPRRPMARYPCRLWKCSRGPSLEHPYGGVKRWRLGVRDHACCSHESCRPFVSLPTSAKLSSAARGLAGTRKQRKAKTTPPPQYIPRPPSSAGSDNSSLDDRIICTPPPQPTSKNAALNKPKTPSSRAPPLRFFVCLFLRAVEKATREAVGDGYTSAGRARFFF